MGSQRKVRGKLADVRSLAAVPSSDYSRTKKERKKKSHHTDPQHQFPRVAVKGEVPLSVGIGGLVCDVQCSGCMFTLGQLLYLSAKTALH